MDRYLLIIKGNVLPRVPQLSSEQIPFVRLNSLTPEFCCQSKWTWTYPDWLGSLKVPLSKVQNHHRQTGKSLTLLTARCHSLPSSESWELKSQSGSGHHSAGVHLWEFFCALGIKWETACKSFSHRDPHLAAQHQSKFNLQADDQPKVQPPASSRGRKYISGCLELGQGRKVVD